MLFGQYLPSCGMLCEEEEWSFSPVAITMVCKMLKLRERNCEDVHDLKLLVEIRNLASKVQINYIHEPSTLHVALTIDAIQSLETKLHKRLINVLQYLIQVGECIFYFQSLELTCPLSSPCSSNSSPNSSSCCLVHNICIGNTSDLQQQKGKKY